MIFRSEIQLKAKGRTDPNKNTLIRKLRKAAVKNDSNIWALLAFEMSKSNRRRATVNISHLKRISSPGDILLIPGKVLGAGILDHGLEVAAESFSEVAQKKITDAGGQCLSIEKLIETNPKGSQVRIIK